MHAVENTHATEVIQAHQQNEQLGSPKTGSNDRNRICRLFCVVVLVAVLVVGPVAIPNRRSVVVFVALVPPVVPVAGPISATTFPVSAATHVAVPTVSPVVVFGAVSLPPPVHYTILLSFSPSPNCRLRRSPNRRPDRRLPLHSHLPYSSSPK